MIGEMTREAVEGGSLSNTGKSENQKKTERYGASGTSGAQSTSQAKAAGGAQNPDQPWYPWVNQGRNSSYTISQQKSDVSTQYRESFAQEQNFWLEQMGLETETNGKEAEDKKEKGQGKVDEMQKQLDSLKRMLERMREQQKKAKEKAKNKPKKKTNYSYRRISNVISGAKTSTQASLALSTASANLSMVRRMAASGQYDTNDVNLALAHAQKMVRTARKKCTNIKYEVYHKNRNKSVENHQKQKVAKVHRPPRKQKMQRELERLKTLIKTSESLEKNRNRRTEDMELMMANMQYVRRKLELLKSEQYNLNTSDAIADALGIDVSGEDITSSAVQMENLGMAETAMNAQAGAEAAAASGDAGAASAPSGGEA